MKVIFKLDKPNNDRSLIMMVYRYSGKKLTMSTSISINTDHWDFKSQRIKKIKGFQEYITYNKTLEKYRLALLSALDVFVAKNDTPTLLQLREAVYTKMNPEKNNSSEFSSNICRFIQQVISDLNDSKRETSKAYSQILKNLKAFPNGPQLEFKDLTLHRLEKFRDFYIKTPRESGQYYRRGTIYRHLKHFFTLINKAKDYGITVNEAYSKSNWRIQPPNASISGNNVVLSEEEILLIENAELSDRHDRIRDIFLLGLYTGQRYGDYSKISRDNIIEVNGIKYLEIVQKKTKAKIMIPYSEKIQKVIDKYNGYPKSISLQKFNDGIKEVCEAIGINEPVIIYEDIPAIREVEKTILPKWKFVSSHTARRTFCTNSKLKGVPDKLLMHISGHTRPATLYSYIRINPETKLAEDLMLKFYG
jgi:integrase